MFADLIVHVVRNYRVLAKYPGLGCRLRSRLQPHSADVAVGQRDVHIPHPPGGVLCGLALEAANQVGVGINPDFPSEQMSVFAPGKQLKHVAALAVHVFFADEAEIIVLRREVG